MMKLSTVAAATLILAIAAGGLASAQDTAPPAPGPAATMQPIPNPPEPAKSVKYHKAHGRRHPASPATPAPPQ